MPVTAEEYDASFTADAVVEFRERCRATAAAWIAAGVNATDAAVAWQTVEVQRRFLGFPVTDRYRESEVLLRGWQLAEVTTLHDTIDELWRLRTVAVVLGDDGELYRVERRREEKPRERHETLYSITWWMEDDEILLDEAGVEAGAGAAPPPAELEAEAEARPRRTLSRAILERRRFPRKLFVFAVLLTAIGISAIVAAFYTVRPPHRPRQSAAGVTTAPECLTANQFHIGKGATTGLFVIGGMALLPGIYYICMIVAAWRRVPGYTYEHLPLYR